jgi:hypothetical protein
VLIIAHIMRVIKRQPDKKLNWTRIKILEMLLLSDTRILSVGTRILLIILLLPLVCMIPLEHFRTIDYVHLRDGRLVYLQKFTGAG